MAVYGVTVYGTDYYGFDTPPAYRVDPFLAASFSYNSVSLSWTKPAGDILAYRLIRNRYGYPSDQDDGEILLDSENYPGSQFTDTTVIPGEYHYYGFYVLLDFLGNVWVRSGLTACLAVSNFNSYNQIYSLIPEYFTNAADDGDELTADAVQNTYLELFTQVIAWGIDQLKTQYDTYRNINNPWTVPLSSLYNLAAQMGIDINPDISPYTLRKAVYYNATVNQQRGTPSGIATEVSALTGWNLDLQTGKNMLLENDQSGFSDPSYSAWSSSINYNSGERITYTGSGPSYFYQCINATGNIGNPPTGTTSSNTWWEAVLSVNDNTVLLNAATGNPDTWEVLYPSVSNGTPVANSVAETLGVIDPLGSGNFTYNRLTAINNGGSAQNLWLRSVSRTTADLETVTTTFAPDKYQCIADGMPVPYSLPSQEWNASTRYGTNDIVTYSSQPFIALRASTGAVPPYEDTGTASAEWAPLSWEPRYRVCMSAYCLGSTAVQVTPFAEWYDSQGNYIMRVLARNSSPGSVEMPGSFAYDSFTTGAGTSISGRTTDDGGNTWTQGPGTIAVSPFSTGCVYPEVAGQRTYAYVNSGTPNCQVGVTFLTNPQSGQSQALMLRWVSDNSYLRADYTALKENNGGTWTTLGTYSSSFAAGDRMVVQLNGSSVTVLRNGNSVLSVTSSFNSSSGIHGIINENT
jgi:hypothetical protein